MKEKLKTVLHFILNPRFLLCFGLAWLITNGWSYIVFALGILFQISWMIAISGAYMALLWFPFTPEKLITLIIAMALLRFLFPHDEKTLGVLREMYAKTKVKVKEKRAVRASTRKNKKENDEANTEMTKVKYEDSCQ